MSAEATPDPLSADATGAVQVPRDTLPDQLAEHVSPDVLKSIMQDVADLVVVANRLPVDRTGTDAQGRPTYQRSPGGLVTALEPVMRSTGGAWVGWPGTPGEVGEPFEADGIRLIPVPLSTQEFAEYYEGFSNATLWPLYHDVIVGPQFRRSWWESYVAVNERFAEATARHSQEGATVWVQDYQLQLVPAMLRQLRPDLTIGFFNHIPFPGYEIFSQLPWRTQVIRGVLGADLVGFQRRSDATNFLRACRRATGLHTRSSRIGVEGADGRTRVVRAEAFPISIDAKGFEQLAKRPEAASRAREIRAGLGNPRTIILGVDRLDYTKGIRHRLKAFEECLQDGRLAPDEAVLVQVASPSRERVQAYRSLRDEVELTVGRINGDHASIGRAPVHYLHQSFPREEMAALYLAADVMLVTALRDGMNLVAKEYVAARHDEDGVLVLSEFAGASDELGQALLVNPHDIDGMKDQLVRAVRMPSTERRRRMRALRRRLFSHDVARWARTFLGALAMATGGGRIEPGLDTRLRELAGTRDVLLAFDFDGVLAPIVDRPGDAQMPEPTREAFLALAAARPGRVALVSGRALADLRERAEPPEGVLLVGSHGAEVDGGHSPLDEAAQRLRETLEKEVTDIVSRHQGTAVENKPAGVVLHTRQARREAAEAAAGEVLAGPAARAGVRVTHGKEVVELSVVDVDKGRALQRLREETGADVVLYAGDDVTDEHAFEVLDETAGDVTIKVGDGRTLARWRVSGPEAMPVVLAALTPRDA